MINLIGMEGGHNETWFKVLDTKETTIKIYPSIKDGKVMSALETGLSQDFFKYKAVNPNCVEIWAVADYDKQVRRVCNAG